MGQWHWRVAEDHVTWDQRTKQIYGLDPEREDLSFSDALAALHPEDAARSAEHVETALRTGHFPPIEVRLLVDGQVRWIRSTGAVLTDHAGRAVEVFGGIIDITEERLERQREGRERALAALGRLAGGIAHDFNNLLLSIIGNLELAQDADPAVQAEQLQEALGACHQAADLAQRLMIFGGRGQHHFSNFDLGALVSEAEPLLRRRIGDDTELFFAAPPVPLIIRGDPALLEQVLINLCINARQAQRPDVAAWIRVELTSEDGFAVLRVADNGVGMSEEVRSRLFEPFFTTRERGTGLGLASVHGTIELHSGRIEVQSTPDHGSCFEVRLPLATP